jgi:hypothetical protein
VRRWLPLPQSRKRTLEARARRISLGNSYRSAPRGPFVANSMDYISGEFKAVFIYCPLGFAAVEPPDPDRGTTFCANTAVSLGLAA